MIDPIKEIKQNRRTIREPWGELRTIETARDKNEPKPEQFIPLDDKYVHVPLDTTFPNITQKTLTECIKKRRSLRQYSETNLTKEEVSYLLFETARVDDIKRSATFRTIPTGGATNGMETYLYVHRVDGLQRGLYHYQQTSHTLQLLDDSHDIDERVNEALFHQLRNASIVVILTTVPYRSEYKYSFCAHKMLAMEAGHAGQNLSLAAEVVDSGACALAAYHQDLLDQVLGVDIEKEFATYALTVGKK
jgi:SagB-type dehydrogenase family enzyme